MRGAASAVSPRPTPISHSAAMTAATSQAGRQEFDEPDARHGQQSRGHNDGDRGCHLRFVPRLAAWVLDCSGVRRWSSWPAVVEVAGLAFAYEPPRVVFSIGCAGDLRLADRARHADPGDAVRAGTTCARHSGCDQGPCWGDLRLAISWNGLSWETPCRSKSRSRRCALPRSGDAASSTGDERS